MPKRYFKLVLIAFAIIGTVGYGVCLLSMFFTISESDFAIQQVCLRADCIKNFADKVEPSLSVGKATSDLLVAIATAGGIIVALSSYFNAVENSALANHISHFSTFQSYLNSEVSKRSRINPSSIDTFNWYNIIFPNSKNGRMVVSESYKKLVSDLNDQIVYSNNLNTTPTGVSFRYKPHQIEIRDRLQKIGILISLQPRIEYYEAEDQIISLINCINKSFCVGSGTLNLADREYI